MGYCYDSRTGHIVCDGCGTTGNGTRKRTCPFTVTFAMSHGAGSRQSVNYCAPSVLCSDCFAKAGKTKGVHASCAEGAAERQAEEDAKQARLDAGDMLVIVAYGDWDDRTPEGFVRVGFQGLHGATAMVLMAAEDYCQHAFTLNEYRELTQVLDIQVKAAA